MANTITCDEYIIPIYTFPDCGNVVNLTPLNLMISDVIAPKVEDELQDHLTVTFQNFGLAYTIGSLPIYNVEFTSWHLNGFFENLFRSEHQIDHVIVSDELAPYIRLLVDITDTEVLIKFLTVGCNIMPHPLLGTIHCVTGFYTILNEDYAA